MQGLLRIGAEDEHAVASADRPILSFDLHPGLLCGPVESVGTVGRFFDVLGSLFGETKQTDVSGHMIPLILFHSHIPRCAVEVNVSAHLPLHLSSRRFEIEDQTAFWPDGATP